MGSIADKQPIQASIGAEARDAKKLFVRDVSTPWFELVATKIEITTDFIATGLGVVVSYKIYQAFSLGKEIRYPANVILLTAALFGILFVLMLDRDGGYRKGNGLLRVKETERVLRVSAQEFLFFSALGLMSAHLVSRWVLCIAFGVVPLLVLAEKQLCFGVTRFLHARGFGMQKVIVYGAGDTGRRVFSTLARSPKAGLNPVAFVDDDLSRVGQTIYASGYRRETSAQVLHGPVNSEMLRSLGVETIIVAIPGIGRERFAELASLAATARVRLVYVPSQLLPSAHWVDYVDIDGLMLASFGGPAPKSLYEAGKRILDLLVSLVLVIALAPALLLIAAVVRLDSRGPVLFRQTRIGKNGKPFAMYKFRSMLVDAPAYSYSPKESQDPRITRVGRYLRKSSLDELPQLFNVIKGEMSLVGPRPEMPFIVEQYGPREEQRLDVIPGITGLWQLSADRAFLIHENLQYDLYYIRHRGFFMDLAILLHTAVFAMRGV
jgi:exopolysaccharide biosynthesis polyprenyl glycosylphosphotransferase